jgi:osmotically inducible protein OsmC
VVRARPQRVAEPSRSVSLQELALERNRGTNPEELIGAAYAGCYSMALAAVLGRAGFQPERITTTARVRIQQVNGGFAIDRIELETEGKVPGIDEEQFKEFAEQAKRTCPVGRALGGVEEIVVRAQLVQ